MSPRNYNVPVNYPQLVDREWLYRRYVVEDSGLKAIADEVGCTTAAVTRALGHAGIDIKGRGRHGHRMGPARKWEPTREELIAEYLDAGSLTELARRRGLSKATIRNVFARRHIRPMDIELPDHRLKFPQLHDKEWLARELQTKSTEQVADEIGCTQSAVWNAAAKYGINPRAAQQAAQQATKDRAIRLYAAGNPLKTVARVLGHDQAQVYRWLRAAGVDTTKRTSRNKR